MGGGRRRGAKARRRGPAENIRWEHSLGMFPWNVPTALSYRFSRPRCRPASRVGRCSSSRVSFGLVMSRSLVGPDRVELVPQVRAGRGVATVNVSREDKEVFDAVQLWLQQRLGRGLSQWDVFSFLLGEALGNEDSPLREAALFPRK